MDESFSRLLFRTTLIGCLLGAAGTFYFLVGLAGFVGSLWLNFFVATATSAAVFLFLLFFTQTIVDAGPLGRSIAGAIFIVLIAEILLGLVPPTARDELTHHLAIPRLYARAGRIIEVPMAPYAYYPMLLDMLYTPWVYWRLDSVPKLIHGLFGFLTGLTICAYLARRMNIVYGLVGFFFFVSVPVVLRLQHWAYVDLGTAYYSTAALFCLLRWREDQSVRSWLVLAAVSTGFAAATKPNGLVAAFILSLLMVFAAPRRVNRPVARIAWNLALFGILAALPFAPWLIKNWAQTGNPFFPLLAGFFPARNGGGGAAAVTFAGVGIFAKRQFLYGESWWQIAALPLRLFLFGRDDNPQYFDGVLSPILIVFLPWAFKGKWLTEKKFVASFSLLYLAYALFLVDLRVRYILPIVPALVTLMVYGVFNLYLRMKRPRILFAILGGFALFNGYYLWSYFQAVRPLPYVFGAETRREYLERMLPEYAVFDYANSNLPDRVKIYLLFVGRRGYYCERDYVHDGGELPALLMRAIQSARDPSDIKQNLQKQGITHLIVREDLLVRFLGNNLTPDQQRRWNGFAGGFLRPEIRNDKYALYRLDG